MSEILHDGYVHTIMPDGVFPEPTIVDMSDRMEEIKAIPLSEAVSVPYKKHAAAMATQLRKIEAELRRCATSNYGTYDSTYSTNALLKNLCEIMFSYPNYHTLPVYDESVIKENTL